MLETGAQNLIMKRIWFCKTLLIIACFLVYTMGYDANVEEKEEATMPMTSNQSPPEGNTTFLDGTTWCVAHPWASENDLQIALDWACGVANTDCSPIRYGGQCYQPNTVASHASYAFNIYYQQNGNNDIACNFGGTATLTNKNPSYGKCVYDVSRPSSLKSATTRPKAHTVLTTILLLIFLTIRFKL